MAFRFQIDETLEEGIRRVAHEQLRRSAHRLTGGGADRDDDVHGARKAMKRLRGLVRLVRTCLGDQLYRLENDAYRDAAGRLAGLRDATVLIKTLESVQPSLDDALTPMAGRVHAWLTRRREQAYAAAKPQDEAIARVVEDLLVADARIDDWPLAGCEWPHLGRGMGRIYARGRREYDACCWRPSVVALHDWRKRVKYLWYHLQLLQPAWSGPLQALVDELDRLGDLLGLDHDCAVLADVISGQMPLPASAEADSQALFAAIFARRRCLQEECRILGQRVYAEGPRPFIGRMSSYWDAWQEERLLRSRPAPPRTGNASAPARAGEKATPAPGGGAGPPVPECLVDLPCQTGEGPLWHADEGCLYWVDIPRGRLYRYDPVAATHALVLERDGAIGGFTIQADGALLLFMEKGAIALWRGPGTELESVIDEIEPERASRFNDVIADPRGRVLCGTMASKATGGRLYRLDTDGGLTELLDEVGCSNGMGFTPDDRGLFFIDSATGVISRFDYDAAAGELGERQVFVDTGSEDGVPDGMTVDAEGNVWCARWDGSCLVRYDPEGRELQRIRFPTRKVSSLTFGGDDLGDLYVTTAGGQDRDANGPQAGSLFRLRPGARGRPEFRSRVGIAG